MSHFHYDNQEKHESCIAVKCNVCSEVLFTPITGFEFGEHVKYAREKGWAHILLAGGKWVDYCPDCYIAYKEQKRKKYFGEAKA